MKIVSARIKTTLPLQAGKGRERKGKETEAEDTQNRQAQQSRGERRQIKTKSGSANKKCHLKQKGNTDDKSTGGRGRGCVQGRH